MQDTNFYAMFHHFNALKHVIHRFTTAKRCGANAVTRWRTYEVARRSGEASARPSHRARRARIRVGKLEAGPLRA